MTRVRRYSTALCLVASGVALLGVALPRSARPERTALGAETSAPTRSVSNRGGGADVVESTAPEVVSIRSAQRSKQPGWAFDLGVGIALALAVIATARVALGWTRHRAPFSATGGAHSVRGPPLRFLS